MKGKPLPFSASRSGRFEIHSERPAVELFSIQSRNGGSSLMSFHFDEPKSLAPTGEDIRHQLRRAHLPILCEQGLQLLLTGVGGKIADK